MLFSDELEKASLGANFPKIRAGGWKTHASQFRNVPLGMAVFVLIISSFKLRGIDRPR